jgi:uncharacterized membrane protein YfcA
MHLRLVKAFVASAVIGTLGGLIGLGGAEFRLPVLVGLFGFSTLQAVVVNLAVSLVTVCASLAFRASSIPLVQVVAAWPIILNLLAGSLFGSYIGVHFATKINERMLNRIVLLFLVFLGLVLISHGAGAPGGALALAASVRLLLGVAAGVGIGVFSSMLGVAGGELIIPTLLFLFSVDMKLAGSLSLAISVPTIIMGLIKYRSHDSFQVFTGQRDFLLVMAAGSITGAFAGSHLLPYVSAHLLKTVLGVILLISAVKLFYHRKR